MSTQVRTSPTDGVSVDTYPAVIDTVTLLRDVLQYSDTECVAIAYKEPRDGVYNPQCVNLIGAAKRISQHTEHDCWFGINPRRGGVGIGRSGDSSTITRLAGGLADIDIKPNFCRDMDHALQIVNAIGDALGMAAAVITATGHGLHPIWPISDGTFTDQFTREQGASLLRRFGALVNKISNEHGSRRDTVYDLPRVGRVAGTVNHKDPAKPVRTVAWRYHAQSFTVAQLTAKLDELDIADPKPAGADEPGEVVSLPSQWVYADQNCNYAQTAIDNWCNDVPSAERHNWMGGQATRISLMHRYGCLSFDGHGEAERALEDALRSRRELSDPDEVERFLQWGRTMAAGKTDAETADELGNHTHHDTGFGMLAGLDLDAIITEATPAAADEKRLVAVGAEGLAAKVQAELAASLEQSAVPAVAEQTAPGPVEPPAAAVESPAAATPDEPVPAAKSKKKKRSKAAPEHHYIAPTIGNWPAPTLPRVEDVKWIKTRAEAEAAGWVIPAVRRRRTKGGGLDTSFDPFDAAKFPLGHPCSPDLLRISFNYNDVSRAVFHGARRRNPKETGPFAMMSTEIIRVGVRANPEFQLSPGTTLSLLVMRGGRSGKGKSTATTDEKFLPIEIYVAASNEERLELGGAIGNASTLDRKWDYNGAVGSGENLADRLFEEVQVPDPLREGKTVSVRQQIKHCSLWAENDEMSAALKKGGAESSILMDAYCSSWSGKPFSFGTRGHGELPFERRFNVFISGGIQPVWWPMILKQVAGFLQRVLFVSVSDPWRLSDLDGNVEFICDPVPAGWKPPRMPAMPDGGRFTFCDEMIADLKDDDSTAVEFSEDDDDWETHHMLNRQKVAGGLALRFGTTTICPNIWRLSGFYMEHHRRTLAHLEVAGKEAGEVLLDQAGKDRQAVAEAAKTAEVEKTREVATSVLQKLAAAGGMMSWSQLEQKHYRTRHTAFPAAMKELDKTCIRYEEGSRSGSINVILVGSDADTPEPPQQESTVSVSPVRIAPATPPATPAA
jgi:hypothetical protein